MTDPHAAIAQITISNLTPEQYSALLDWLLERGIKVEVRKP